MMAACSYLDVSDKEGGGTGAYQHALNVKQSMLK